MASFRAQGAPQNGVLSIVVMERGKEAKNCHITDFGHKKPSGRVTPTRGTSC